MSKQTAEQTEQINYRDIKDIIQLKRHVINNLLWIKKSAQKHSVEQCHIMLAS